MRGAELAIRHVEGRIYDLFDFLAANMGDGGSDLYTEAEADVAVEVFSDELSDLWTDYKKDIKDD